MGDYRSHHILPSSFLTDRQPTIDVLVTTAGEPTEIIRETIVAAVRMDYPHMTFVLDDGKSAEVKTLAYDAGAVYIARANHYHAKAGNINNGLRYSRGDFFAILDADQAPKKDFITQLLPYMDNEKLAMVQSPQYFANTLRSSRLARPRPRKCSTNTSVRLKTFPTRLSPSGRT